MALANELVRAVQRNCDIADARHAGDYTLCIFLLKMREHYRWEKRLPFSAPLPKDAVGDWLAEREALWNEIEAEELVRIPMASGLWDPFHGAEINADLLRESFVYSAGYGRHLRPHFFLGDLLRQERHDGVTVLVSGREYARDMAAPMAMLQGDTVFVRQESICREVWARIEEWQWYRQEGALDRALRGFGDHLPPEGLLERVTTTETETVILHELGEVMAGKALGHGWFDLHLSGSCGRAEIITRAVRDLLADALSTLPALVAKGHPPALHLYFANLRGMRRELAPRWIAAYDRWVADGDLGPLRDATAEGAETWRRTAQIILDLHRDDPESWAMRIEQVLGLA